MASVVEPSARLAQYAAFAQARLHFSRLFFQTVAVLTPLSLTLAGAALAPVLDAALRPWLLACAGLVLIQGAFIVARLQQHERTYEKRLQALETVLELDLRHPQSGRFGAKSSVVISLSLLGIVLIAAAVTMG
jgi:hypothetical protein